jgi:hypothetical protein
LSCNFNGFFYFFCSSTLMPRTKNLEGSGHLLRSDVSLNSNSFQVSLRFSKTRQFNDTVLVYPVQEIPGSLFCPVKAWQAHVEASPTPPNAPAFLWQGGAFLYYSLFSTELQSLVSLAGIQKLIRPHSLRCGGASKSLRVGVSPLLIKLQGDWASDAWLRYVKIGVDQRRAVSTALASCFH